MSAKKELTTVLQKVESVKILQIHLRVDVQLISTTFLLIQRIVQEEIVNDVSSLRLSNFFG